MLETILQRLIVKRERYTYGIRTGVVETVSEPCSDTDPSLLVPFYLGPVVPYLVCILCALPQEVMCLSGEVFVLHGQPDSLLRRAYPECLFGSLLDARYVVLCESPDRPLPVVLDHPLEVLLAEAR